MYELLQLDADRNAARSPAVFSSSSGNYVDAQGKLTCLIGVKDLVVVDTPDALLVATRDRAQRVGEILKMLEERDRHDLL